MAKLLLSVAEAAAELGIPQNKAYVWCASKVLPSVRNGGRIYVARQAVERLIERIANGELADIG